MTGEREAALEVKYATIDRGARAYFHIGQSYIGDRVNHLQTPTEIRCGARQESFGTVSGLVGKRKQDFATLKKIPRIKCGECSVAR